MLAVSTGLLVWWLSDKSASNPVLNGDLAGIIIGVTVGAAILLLTKTDKGREWLSGMSDAADDVKDNLKDKAGSLEKQFKDLIKKGKAFISDLEDKAKDITSSIAD